MRYVTQEERDFIMGKYHDPEKPFNSRRRFVRRDDRFSPESGMAPEEIQEGLLRLAEEYAHLHPSVSKAKAFAYVLDNTRIRCCKLDRFPAINMVDRPLHAPIINPRRKQVLSQLIPDLEAQMKKLKQTGAANIIPDYDHSVPHWDRVFTLGFVGLLQESQKGDGPFYEAIQITYESVLRLLGRLADAAEDPSMACALRNLQTAPPKTFYEALLTDYIYFMLSEHIEGIQVRSLGNFDRIFYPYYKNDLQNGVPEEALKRDLTHFLLQFPGIGNYWNQPVFLGGCKADESTEINELSYIFLDIYDELGCYSPKIQIKVAESTPKEFLLKVLDMIRRGKNSVVLINDATIRKALVLRGATEEQARCCNLRGCHEYVTQEGMLTEMNYTNLLKPLEYALHQGCDGVTGEFMGRKSPDVSTYADFDALFAEYKAQLTHLIDMVTTISNNFDNYLAYISPSSLLSATYESCLKKGKDALAGGAEYNFSIIDCGFLADICDSLTALQKYVFTEKKYTLAEFTAILDANFEGHELLRRQLLADKEKYGNNCPVPDSFAVEITRFIADLVHSLPESPDRNSTWSCGFHVARMSYDVADSTAASPNGRCRGEELSKNASASMGQNRQGATAAILTSTKIDASYFTGDVVSDLGIHNSAVKGAAGLEAMYSLVQTFLRLGGHAMQINVFSADTLIDAQKHPEKYTDLQIRVCGWNVLWNNIAKEEQDGFIRQAQSLA